MTIKPVYVEAIERYDLGEIVHSFTGSDRVPVKRRLGLFMRYTRCTPHFGFVCGEYIQFEIISGERPVNPPIYNAEFSKLTNEEGEVRREVRLEGKKKRKPLDLSQLLLEFYDDDIPQRIKKLPPYIRDVLRL